MTDDAIDGGCDALVKGCDPDRELTVIFKTWPGGLAHPSIPRFVAVTLRARLPETWKVANRGSRLEVHPSGRFAGGVHPIDAPAVVERALNEMGLTVHTARPEGYDSGRST